MSETARRMLVHGIAAAHAGDTAEAQRYLERVLYHDADRDQLIKARLWLSRISHDPAIQREHLEEVLAADPTHGEARRELAILDGDLNPKEIIDPDCLQQPAPQGFAEPEPQSIEAKRIVCPQCGGTVRFEPGKSWMQCRYCGHRQPIVTALTTQRSPQEEDFIVTLATAKGHAIPEGLRCFRCRGCQATLLTTNELSTHCPYCGSTHIVEVDTRATIPPDGLIPFAVAEAAAETAFHTWLTNELGNHRDHLARVRTTRLRGVYLPMWTFDLMGEIGWRGREPDSGSNLNGVSISFREGDIHIGSGRQSGQLGRSRVHEGSHYVLVDDAIVPATHKVPFALREVFDQFDLARIVPYDAAFLSDWPAEIYEIAVGDASLVARRRVLEEAGHDIRIQATAEAGNLQDLQTFSRNLSVQSYKLILVPMWLANYRHENETYTVVVNGQTGDVCGEKPPSMIKRALRVLGLGDQ